MLAARQHLTNLHPQQCNCRVRQPNSVPCTACTDETVLACMEDPALGYKIMPIAWLSTHYRQWHWALWICCAIGRISGLVPALLNLEPSSSGAAGGSRSLSCTQYCAVGALQRSGMSGRQLAGRCTLECVREMRSARRLCACSQRDPQRRLLLVLVSAEHIHTLPLSIYYSIFRYVCVCLCV